MVDQTEVVELLHTLTEVSIAFVGFSTIVAALRIHDDSKFRLFSIRDVAIVGLVALSGATVPLYLLTFMTEETLVWRTASLWFSAAWIVSAYFGIRSYNRSVEPELRPKYLIVGPISGLIANPMLWWNIVAPGAWSAPIYLAALLLLLVFVAVSFVAATFHNAQGGV